MQSAENTKTVFVLAGDKPAVERYVEGHTLMESQSNRQYIVVNNGQLEAALSELGLHQLPASLAASE